MSAPWGKIAIVSTAILIGLGSYILTNKPDGPVEQIAEIILQINGIDIDLSPE